MKTKIWASAIKFENKTYFVLKPGRHSDVINHICKTCKVKCVGGEHPQGFLTTDNRFVDRIEAAKIALESGQIQELKWPPKLYSEDLW